EPRRRLLRQAADAARGRMQSGLQGVEGDAPAEFDHEFAIDDKPLERRLLQGRHDLGKIAAQRCAGLSLELDRAVILESETPKAIPFRLELPCPRLLRKPIRGFRLHGRRAEPQGVEVGIFDAGSLSGVHPRILPFNPLSHLPAFQDAQRLRANLGSRAGTPQVAARAPPKSLAGTIVFTASSLAWSGDNGDSNDAARIRAAEGNRRTRHA